MPLYELIVIAKANNPKGTLGLIQTVSKQILDNGGNVRTANILGDRLLNRQLKSNDGKRHLVGRYLQILYDGNPSIQQSIEKYAKDSNDGMRIKTFRVKDFFNDAQTFKRALEQKSPITPVYMQNKEYLRKLKEIANKY
ncbi:hypothetical protein IMG5_061650 [Ichthyophthirius multifiliis]|uniref:Ribosomal protein S6 n=1 Tax=Ichthyophthirius multifiliis TaxID=5932 RepID=G0QNV5_ICHMU|nr:hypothetical protein IMG5_061650 [Ichthyophthirius multifiliis]EGR33109.1 hypothetical protein IMG5_061650 [Ichthyophthirius multifiliis]|eukprot:XP_004037095.1 hypothetical protein IMG5_061650 [Ichthyophthirius multifiliis]